MAQSQQVRGRILAKKSRHGHSTLYWVVFTVCAVSSFAGGFFYTYHATSQVAVKNPNTNENFFQGGVVPQPLPSETPAAEASPTPYDDPFGGELVSPTPRAVETPMPRRSPTPYIVVYTAPPEPTATPAPARDVYRVQVGSYDTKEAAQSMVDELLSNGITASVVFDQGQYHAQVGAFSDRDRALSVASDIDAQGYAVIIRK